MTSIFELFTALLPGWTGIFEILVMAALLYRLLLFVRGTRAMQMLLGLLVLIVVFFIAKALELILIPRLMEAMLQYGAIAALVVFQPELRSALARLGRNPILRYFDKMEASEVAEEIVDAVSRLSRARIGAIIAVELEVGLDEFAQTGSRLDAPVSADLLTTIFTPHSPLHDGAVIIKGDLIGVAGAILPLTQRAVSDRTMGTRHRAALGLSEEADALVVVVSEETSRISVARFGRFERDIDLARLRSLLTGAAVERPGGFRIGSG